MALSMQTHDQEANNTEAIAIHPLNPLTRAEIFQTAALLRSHWPSGTDLRFKSITLLEPEKAKLIPYLDAEHNGKAVPPMERRSFACYYIRNTVSASRAGMVFVDVAGGQNTRSLCQFDNTASRVKC